MMLSRCGIPNSDRALPEMDLTYLSGSAQDSPGPITVIIIIFSVLTASTNTYEPISMNVNVKNEAAVLPCAAFFYMSSARSRKVP